MDTDKTPIQRPRLRESPISLALRRSVKAARNYGRIRLGFEMSLVMPVAITDVDALKGCIEGVMGRAEHHAGNVDAVALTLAGAIIWRKDPDPIEVMSQGSETKNVLWVKIGGQRYAFSYNHAAQTIEIRKGNTHGAVLNSFSNATPTQAVIDYFRIL